MAGVPTVAPKPLTLNPKEPMMTLYDPDLSIAACHEAMDRGRQMVLDDLEAHPAKSAEHYALAAASLVHSMLMPNARKHLLAKLAANPVMAGQTSATPSDYINHKRDLEEMRQLLGIDGKVWACGMQDIAVGMARAADELFQADGDPRGCPGASASEFVFRFVYRMPEHAHVGLTTPVVRPADRTTEIAAPPVASKDELVNEAEGTLSSSSDG